MPPLLRRALAPLGIAAAIALAYWPGLRAYWGRDDFMQLAFVRMAGSPWPLFAHDHYFPVPGSIFRPLGFASFWLWHALFGTDYFAHALGDMVLHIAVAIALYRVIRAGALERVPAALCALAFALHPAVLGTALWWSARFDLLAALFVFIALRAAFDYCDTRRIATLVTALVAVMAALLSKETALAGVAAIAFVWLRWARDRTMRTSAVQALLALAATTLAFFVWRWLVLGTAGSGLAGDASLIDAIASGTLDWLRYVGGYVSFWPRLGAATRIAAIVVAIAAVASVVVSSRLRYQWPAQRRFDLLVCGLCLFVLPALLQAPVLALNATPLRADVSAVEAAMQSRLYYLGIGGLAIVLSAWLGRALAVSDRSRRILLVVLAFADVTCGVAAHDNAKSFAERTNAPRAMVEELVAAIDRLDVPADRCHIVVLGVVPPPEWSVYVSMDAVAKALTMQPAKIDRCFVHADYVTYFNLMANTVGASDAVPYLPHRWHGAQVPWLHVGAALVAYLDAPATTDRAALDGFFFLRYENGRFEDVTAAVDAGRIAVELR